MIKNKKIKNYTNLNRSKSPLEVGQEDVPISNIHNIKINQSNFPLKKIGKSIFSTALLKPLYKRFGVYLRQKSFQLIITLLVLVKPFISVFPQSSDSLNHYLELAAKNNPTVLQKFYEYEAAVQKIPQAGSLQDPELSLGVFLTPMELVMGKQVADIRLMQMFPWFGTLRAAKDEMSLMAKAKLESLRDAKLQVFFDVQSTWYELYKNNQNIKISAKNLEILKTIERLALVRFKSAPAGTSGSQNSGESMSQPETSQQGSGMQGMGGNQGNSQNQSARQSNGNMQNGSMNSATGGSGLSDLYRIQIEIGELENSIALLKNIQNTITSKFNSFLNRSPQSAVFIPDTLKPDSFEIQSGSVSDSILKNNPMLGMIEYERQSVEARRKMVSRMGYPMVGIGLNYSLINKLEMSESPMNGEDMIMPMVTITLPIYRKKYKSMKREADLLKAATEQNYSATGNMLQTEYYEAVQLYEDAGRRMKLYRDQYSLAKRTLDLMLKSYSAAGGDLTDIFRIQQQTLDYELKKYEAITDYNTAIAWLKRLGNIN